MKMTLSTPRRWAIAVAFLLALVIAVALLFLGAPREGDPVASVQQHPDFNSVKLKAEQGDREAENLLGEILAEGKQVRQDYAQAARWYRKAAEKGSAKAQYNLGVLLEIGQGVPRDESEAAEWYRKAAEQNHPDAQYNLAALYGLGRGVPPNTAEALKWYHRAAEQGDALACYNLAERYERGKGVAQDLVEAYKWHHLAAKRGFKDGAIARDRLKATLTSAQRSEAEKRIAEFQAKYRDKARPGGA
jgi:TPR repeat protein